MLSLMSAFNNCIIIFKKVGLGYCTRIRLENKLANVKKSKDVP